MPTRSRPTAAGATAIAACAVVLAFVGSTARAQDLRVTDLRVEHATNPLGIGDRAPRLSWTLESAQRGTMQGAYEIRVAADAASLAGKPLWDTGRVASDSSVLRPYAGPALASGRRYAWQVRVWDATGRASAWSAPAWWEMGLLAPTDWRARWITPELPRDTTRTMPSAMLRRGFTIDGRVVSARAYVTSHGLYEMQLNGRRVGDRLFTPGWTSYRKRLQYQVYDVTELLKPGPNAVGVTLGDGWYRGWLAFERNRNTYGTDVALLAQIVVRYADGREQVIATDDQWKAATGPIVASDIYMGERYDARLERAGWSSAGYDDHDWRGVRAGGGADSTIVAEEGPAVRRIQELRPVKVYRTPNGETVADLGQNMVGWVRLRVRGPAGTTIKLRHAEVLDRDGNVYTANLRAAKATVEYVLKGGAEEVYEPHFTFQGFRYVAVEGYPSEMGPDAITGIVIHSDMRPTGTFATSDTMLNKLQHNIVWGQKGNFLDVPTDTPARDERLGWTGDAQAFSTTAAFNFDVAGFFTKWLGDAAADQLPNGAFPDVIPDVLSRGGPTFNAATGWADAGVIVPWNVYQAYGDARLLARQYPSMQRWIEYMRRQAGDDLIWTGGHHYGDWLAFATTNADYPGATTDKDLLATAFFAHSTDLLARSAAALGKTDDARTYRDLFDRIRAAFVREYVTAEGRMSSNTQTAYAIALRFDLLPEALRPRAAQRLADDVKSFGHLTTGFLGTPHLTHVLAATGHTDLAYMLLERQRYPSWLYPITRGATTMWERWDGIKPDGSFQDVGMNSFNHYAYGAIGDWMYRAVAGLDQDAAMPAYKHSLIHPQPGGGLTHAEASLATVYGKLASSWTVDAGGLTMDVTVPPNTTSTVRVPGAQLERVTESGVPVARAPGVTGARQDGADVVVEVGSGTYHFKRSS